MGNYWIAMGDYWIAMGDYTGAGSSKGG